MSKLHFNVAHLLPWFNYMLFFIAMLYCFNTTFFLLYILQPFYTYTQKRKNFDECFLFWPNKIISCVSYQSYAYFFLFCFFIFFIFFLMFCFYFFYIFFLSFFYFFLFFILFFFFLSLSFHTTQSHNFIFFIYAP